MLGAGASYRMLSRGIAVRVGADDTVAGKLGLKLPLQTEHLRTCLPMCSYEGIMESAAGAYGCGMHVCMRLGDSAGTSYVHAYAPRRPVRAGQERRVTHSGTSVFHHSTDLERHMR